MINIGTQRYTKQKYLDFHAKIHQKETKKIKIVSVETKSFQIEKMGENLEFLGRSQVFEKPFGLVVVVMLEMRVAH